MTVYETIGGEASVHAAVEDFYTRLLGDPSLTHFFSGVDLRKLKAHQRAFLAAALGGAQLYQGRDMAAAHADLAITDNDFDAVVAHLVETLAGLGVAPQTIEEIGAKLLPLRPQIVTAPAREPAA
jgi:hemoglobin